MRLMRRAYGAPCEHLKSRQVETTADQASSLALNPNLPRSFSSYRQVHCVLRTLRPCRSIHVYHQPNVLRALCLQISSALLVGAVGAHLVLPVWQRRYCFPERVSECCTGSDTRARRFRRRSRAPVLSVRDQNTDIIQACRINFLNVNGAVFATFLLPVARVDRPVDRMLSVIKNRYEAAGYAASPIQMALYGLLQVPTALDVRCCVRCRKVAATAQFRPRLGVCDSPNAGLDRAEIIGTASICLQDSKFLPRSSIWRTRPCTFHLFTVAIAGAARAVAPDLVEGRSHGLGTVRGEVAKQRAGVAAGHPVRTRSSAHVSVRGPGRTIELPHGAEERHAHAQDDNGGLRGGRSQAWPDGSRASCDAPRRRGLRCEVIRSTLCGDMTEVELHRIYYVGRAGSVRQRPDQTAAGVRYLPRDM